MKQNRGFTPLETGRRRRPTVAFGNLSLTGFTLIEIMLVVIILGVLAAMVVPRLTGRSDEARQSVAKTDIESNLALAIDLYEVDNGGYPDSLDDLLRAPSGGGTSWKGPYLKKIPNELISHPFYS